MGRKSTVIVHGCNAVSYTHLNEEKDEDGEYIKNGCRRLKADVYKRQEVYWMHCQIQIMRYSLP